MNMNTEKDDSQSTQPLIMLVDDNPEFINGMELTLEMEGFKVWTAKNGQDALNQLFAVFKGEKLAESGITRLPDLILADIMMPVIDGYEFYEQTRANPYLNHIPFIFLTAKSSDVDIRRGKEMGSDDYLSKLCSPEDLLASVRGKLNRVKQQRGLAARFTGDLNKPSLIGIIILVAIIIAVGVIAFCAGASFGGIG